MFNKDHGYIDMPQTVACGRCTDCKLDLSRQWAIRIMHEAQLSQETCYITLTYAPEFLPEGGTLELEDWRYFIKKLRRKTNPNIRYYHSGEYGETNTKRPHYHAILFGVSFTDMRLFKTVNGIPLYTSAQLTKIWGKGHASVGYVTMASAAYVARYIMKKQYPSKLHTAQAAYVENYERIDTTTGEIHNVKPEYSTMSRNIGIEWFKKFNADIYNKDFLTFKGEKFRPPKYYDRLYADHNPEHMQEIKRKRNINAAKNPNNTIERLRVRQKVQALKTQKLVRSLSTN